MVKRQKNFKLKQAKGFTLIELMLATSLLMMVMFSGYYAYGLYSQKWQKRVQVFWQNTEQAIALDSLNKAITSALPYAVNCNNDKACIYFKGTKDTISFITNSAIFSSEPALVEFTLIEMNNNNASVHSEYNYQLVYREQAVSDNLALSLDHQVQWQHEIVLLSGLGDFNVSYFGWPSFEKASHYVNSDALIKEDLRVWYNQHDANITRLLPENIQVSFTSEKGNSNFKVALSPHSFYKLLTYIRVEF